MEIKETTYAEVKRYASRAARDRVSVSDIRNTRWYSTDFGICGLLMLSGGTAARIKGVWVLPTERGHGYGSAMTLALIDEARRLGVRRLEALAYNPDFYEGHGWHRVGKPRPNGAVKVEVML